MKTKFSTVWRFAHLLQSVAEFGIFLADTERPEMKNTRALFVIDRVKNKLTGELSHYAHPAHLLIRVS